MIYLRIWQDHLSETLEILVEDKTSIISTVNEYATLNKWCLARVRCFSCDYELFKRDNPEKELLLKEKFDACVSN